MTAAVERLLQVSLTGGALILAVLLLRLAARRAPRWITMALWALVAVRFCCPVTVPVAYSPVPATVTETPTVLTLPVTVIPQWDGEDPRPVSPEHHDVLITYIENEYADDMTLLDIAGWVWVAGIGVMALTALISWWRLRRRVATAVRQSDGSWRSDAIGGPFVLGLFRPRIYLPFTVAEGDTLYVLAHEQAHIRRRDPLWKWLGFCLLTVYWFHPLLWLAYRLFCRDMELCCDARVTATLAAEEKGRYARALLGCAARPTPGLACPVAFGETGVAARVKAVLSPKKPLLWVAAGALLVGIAATVLLLTVSHPGFEGITAGPYEGDPGVTLSLVNAVNRTGEQSITIRWEPTGEEELHLHEGFSVQKKVNGQWTNLVPPDGIVVGHYRTQVNAPYLDRQYALSTYYGDLPEGRYRFTAPFTLGDGKSATHGTAILPFTVSSFDPAGQSIPVEGVSMTLLSTNMTSDEQTVTVLWKNEGNTRVEYGEPFSIQRLVDGKWQSIAPRDGVAFNAIAYMLSPGDEVGKTYQISGHYGNLPNGEYRLVTDFYKGDNKCVIHLPFAVANSFDPSNGLVTTCIEDFSYDRLGELTLSVRWSNETSHTITLDDQPFRVERQTEQGSWYPLPVAVEAATEASELRSFQYTTVDYALGGRYRSLLPGDYRLVLCYTVNGKDKEAFLPFTVADTPPLTQGEATWQITDLADGALTISLANGTGQPLSTPGTYRLYHREEGQWRLLVPSGKGATGDTITSSGEGIWTFPLGELPSGTYRLSFDYNYGEQEGLGMVDFFLSPS